MSPHVAGAIYTGVHTCAGVLWSVGVEEWFYAIWPWALRLRRAALVAISFALIASLPLLRASALTGLSSVFYSLKIDNMAVGAVAAIAFCAKDRSSIVRAFFDLLYSRTLEVGVILSLLYCLATGFSFGIYDDVVYSSLFAAFILNVATNARTIVRLENKWFRFLGDISYGLYCFNWIAVLSAISITRMLDDSFMDVNIRVSTYICAFAISIAVSSASYFCVERYFLRIKGRRFTPGREENPGQPSTPVGGAA